MILVTKSEGRRLLERPRRRWKDDAKMDLREVGYGVDWIDLAQDRERLRFFCECSDERSGFIKCEKNF